MDMDFIKSQTEDHRMTDMMLMQMEKLHDDFSYQDPNIFTSNHHHHQTDHNTNLIDNLHINSPTFLNPHPFSGEFHHHPIHQHHPISSGGCSGSRPVQNRSHSMVAMREMIFRIAAMQPVHIDPESVKPPKRKNVKISTDPQSVAARHRRERISERIRILQRLVPGGTKMDTASMLDEAIHYVKFLKNQVQSLERVAADGAAGVGFPVAMEGGGFGFPTVAGKGFCYR